MRSAGDRSGTTEVGVGLTPIHRPTIGEQVADSIRRLAWEGSLPAGSRLNQEDLAAKLGVSRIPVRDALLALEREGLVRMKPNRGAYLNPIGEEDTRDHYGLFGVLYAFALERAASRADEEGLARLVACASDAGRAKDPDALQDATAEFWRLAVLEGGSPRLRAVSRSLTSLVPGNFFDEIPGAAAVQRSAMKKLAAALRARDGEAAGDVCRSLLAELGELVVAVMRERGLYE